MLLIIALKYLGLSSFGLVLIWSDYLPSPVALNNWGGFITTWCWCLLGLSTPHRRRTLNNFFRVRAEESICLFARSLVLVDTGGRIEPHVRNGRFLWRTEHISYRVRIDYSSLVSNLPDRVKLLQIKVFDVLYRSIVVLIIHSLIVN